MDSLSNRPIAHTNGMVLTCTGLSDRAQNELYLLARSLQAVLVRDRALGGKQFDYQTTHLVVGTLAKTDKLLCGLAAGIPIVSEAYVRHSHEVRGWLHGVADYDVGRQEEQQGEQEVLYVPPLEVRRRIKCRGGVFRGWRVVVLLEQTQKEVYIKMLELGGAVVERWTVQHLLDLQRTHRFSGRILIISRPSYLLLEEFRYLLYHDKNKNVSVITHIYIGDFLTRKQSPPLKMYDVRNPEMWELVEDGGVRKQLVELHLPVWKWQLGGNRVQHTDLDIIVIEPDDNVGSCVYETAQISRKKRGRSNLLQTELVAKNRRVEDKHQKKETSEEIMIVQETVRSLPGIVGINIKDDSGNENSSSSGDQNTNSNEVIEVMEEAFTAPTPAGIAKLKYRAAALLKSQRDQDWSGVNPPMECSKVLSPESPECYRNESPTSGHCNNPSMRTPEIWLD